MDKIPVKDANLTEIRNLDLKECLEQELKDFKKSDKNFIPRIIEKAKTIDYNNADNVPVPLMNKIDSINYKIELYKISDTFSILNKDDYSLIRNGFITIGGEASAGKTSFMTALSIDILSNNPDTCFLFYSLDDSMPMSGKRIFSQLNSKNLFREDISQHHTKGKEKLLNRIVIQDRIDINLLDRQAKAVKETTGCNKIIIGIDYLQIIAGLDISSFDKRDYLNKTLKELKEYQKTLEKDAGCIMFVLSQFNRNTKSDTYRYRDTSEIENQSDVCIDLTDIRETNDNKKCIEIKISKNKLGKRNLYFTSELTPHFTFLKLNYKDTQKNNTSKDNKQELEQEFIGGLSL